MKAIGLAHRMRALAGLRPTTTANGSLWVTGKEIAAVLNMITIGTATTTGTSATETMTGTATGTVIRSTTGAIDNARRRNRFLALAARASKFQDVGKSSRLRDKFFLTSDRAAIPKLSHDGRIPKESSYLGPGLSAVTRSAPCGQPPLRN
jgi:hypothetical protein